MELLKRPLGPKGKVRAEVLNQGLPELYGGFKTDTRNILSFQGLKTLLENKTK